MSTTKQEKKGKKKSPKAKNGTKQVTADDVAKAQETINAMVELGEKVRKRLRKATKERKPRGIRITLKRLKDLCCVLQATKAVADLFSVSGQEARNALDECGLLTEAKMGMMSLETQLEKMKKATKAMKTAMEASDYDEADVQARDIHRAAMNLDIRTGNMAGCVREASHAYPGKHGQLTLFSHLMKLEDEESIARINRTIRWGGKVEVAVEDADAMIAAIEADDQQTIEDIMRRAIESA